MATTFDLQVIFRAIDKMSVPMARMQKKFDDFKKKTNEVGKKFRDVGGMFTKYITLPILGLAGLGIKNFAEQEEAILRLKNAIKITGREGEISVKNLSDFASELQNVTKYGDDATLSAMAIVQSMGNLNEKQLKEITPRIQDFAAAMGMDLTAAAQLFGKTMSTGTNYFQRYGIQIKETGNKQELLTRLTSELDKKFKGMSQESAKGLSGSLAQLQNNFGDLTESIGEYLAPIIAKVSVKLKQFKDWFEKLDPKTRNMIITTGLLAAAIGPLLIAIGMAIQLFGALSAVASPLGLALVAIAAQILIITALLQGWKNLNWVEKFQRGVLIATNLLFPFAGLQVLIMSRFKKLDPFFDKLWKGIAKKAEKPLKGIKDLASKIGKSIKQKWQDSGLGKFFEDIWISISESFGKMWDSILQTFVDLWDKIQNSPMFKFFFGNKNKDNKGTTTKENETNIVNKENKTNTINKENKTIQTDMSILKGVNPSQINSKSEIIVKVEAESGTTATIKEVKKDSKTKLKVRNKSEVGSSTLIPSYYKERK